MVSETKNKTGMVYLKNIKKSVKMDMLIIKTERNFYEKEFI